MRVLQVRLLYLLQNVRREDGEGVGVVPLDLWPPPGAVDVDDGKRVGGPVRVEHHGGSVAVLAQVKLEAVAVLGRVLALVAPVLVDRLKITRKKQDFFLKNEL